MEIVCSSLWRTRWLPINLFLDQYTAGCVFRYRKTGDGVNETQTAGMAYTMPRLLDVNQA